MSSIIPLLLQLFGPLIAELIKKLLEKWLNKAERNVKGKLGTVSSDTEAQLIVLKETLKVLPAVAVIKKRLVKVMIKAVEKGGTVAENDADVVEVLGKAVN